MKKMVQRIVVVTLVAFVLLVNQGFAQEKSFPASPINLYVGYPPGGGVSNQSLVIVEVMKKYLNNQAVVLNYKPGAAQAIAADFVSKSKPDGYTLYYCTDTDILLKILQERSSLKFTMDDFDSLGGTAIVTFTMVVKEDSPWKTIEEFIDFGRKSPPGTIQIGSSGLGNAAHLIAESFAARTGVPSTYVPFQGGGPADTALLGGHITACIGGTGRYLERLRPGGGLRSLCVFSSKRNPTYPNVPTMVEKGYDINISARHGMHAPKGLPAAVKNILVQAFEKTVKDPKFSSFLTEGGYLALYYAPEEQNKMNKADAVVFQELLIKAGLIKK